MTACQLVDTSHIQHQDVGVRAGTRHNAQTTGGVLLDEELRVKEGLW